MSHLYLNEQSEHPEENTCKNEVFRSHHSPPWKETKHTHSQLPIYYIIYSVLQSDVLQSDTTYFSSSDWSTLDFLLTDIANVL